MKLSLLLQFDLEFYETEEIMLAQQFARKLNRTLYSWKTIGRSNWLERGLSIADVLGIVVLPLGLPEYIEMPDDPAQ